MPLGETPMGPQVGTAGAFGNEQAASDCYCGDLSWTLTDRAQYGGRLTHKHGCPARTDPWCQTHPTGCPRDV